MPAEGGGAPAPGAEAGPPLTSAQARALTHVRTAARRDRPGATERAARVLSRAGIDVQVGELCARVASRERVALNFHPDRVAADGRTVAEALLEDGLYRNQFETRISNGGLGAVRDRFEARLFAGAYGQPGVVPAERPRYGGLDLVRHPDGPCPRFGSCHLRLRADVLGRSTFSFGDSVTEAAACGTVDELVPVLAALLEAAEGGGHTSVLAACDTVLGLEQPTTALLVDVLVHGRTAAGGPAGRSTTTSRRSCTARCGSGTTSRPWSPTPRSVAPPSVRSSRR